MRSGFPRTERRTTSLALVVLAVIVSGCMGTIKKTYEGERDVMLASSTPDADQELIDESDIASLPQPVSRFFRRMGYVGKPKMVNAEVVWSRSEIRLAPDRGWMKLYTRQFNAVPEPGRVAYMRARIAGLVPFEGRDLYSKGAGSMRGRVAKLFTVMDVSGPELTQSALITLFAEALLVPSYALQEYITWESVGDREARARMRHGAVDVMGLFVFNAEDEFIAFHTEDRYFGGEEGSEKVPFSVFIDRYQDREGLRIPADVRAVWHLQEGDFEYWRGTISEIRYDVRE